MEVRIAKAVRELGIESNVRRLGYVPSQHLDALYDEAIAHLSFALRRLRGPRPRSDGPRLPVIAADATALPEVVGDSGCLVSPDNADQWHQAMIEMSENGGRPALARRPACQGRGVHLGALGRHPREGIPPRSRDDAVRLVVVTPHFAPDVAPTGEVVTRIVEELAARGHGSRCSPRFPGTADTRVEPGYGGRLLRQRTPRGVALPGRIPSRLRTSWTSCAGRRPSSDSARSWPRPAHGGRVSTGFSRCHRR